MANVPAKELDYISSMCDDNGIFRDRNVPPFCSRVLQMASLMSVVVRDSPHARFGFAYLLRFQSSVFLAGNVAFLAIPELKTLGVVPTLISVFSLLFALLSLLASLQLIMRLNQMPEQNGLGMVRYLNLIYIGVSGLNQSWTCNAFQVRLMRRLSFPVWDNYESLAFACAFPTTFLLWR